MYAKGLHSTTISVTHESTDRYEILGQTSSDLEHGVGPLGEMTASHTCGLDIVTRDTLYVPSLS